MFTGASKLQGAGRTILPPTSDPFIANVVLLLHGEGADGGTVITDVKGHTATRVGAPVTATAQKKYGSSSLHFDGASAVQFPTGVDFQFGTGDFTQEAWLYQEVRGSISVVIANEIILYISNTGFPVLTTTVNGLLTSTLSIPLGVWTHVAATRNSGTLRIWVDGKLGGSVADSTPVSNGICQIGQSSTSQRYTGYMDEVRITKGVGRYTAPFFPIGPFPDV